MQGAARAPRVTSPLDTVPFYRILTVTPGQAQNVEVTAPSTLSTYVVRAVAASADGETFGASETEFTVRRKLSLTPSVPRLLRAGDRGSAGVIVTFFGAASEAVPAVVKVAVEASGVKITAPAPQQIQFTASGAQKEVRFPVLAERVGDGKIVFSATTAAATDSLAVDLETLVPQAPVVVSSSFPVAPDQGWKEGLALPEAVPGMCLLPSIMLCSLLSACTLWTLVSAERRFAHRCQNSKVRCCTDVCRKWRTVCASRSRESAISGHHEQAAARGDSRQAVCDGRLGPVHPGYAQCDVNLR